MKEISCSAARGSDSKLGVNCYCQAPGELGSWHHAAVWARCAGMPCAPGTRKRAAFPLLRAAVRKVGNNGAVSCDTYCKGAWTGVRYGTCAAGVDAKTGQDIGCSKARGPNGYEQTCYCANRCECISQSEGAAGILRALHCAHNRLVRARPLFHMRAAGC